MKLEIAILNPAGNITAFVKTKVNREDYSRVANAIMTDPKVIETAQVEQVAFILNDYTMEMCGLEFCGNASRA
ncbi:MAG: hypothetical protein ACRCUS_08615, partial [Anaerovoracaceae bacterium]